MPLVPADLSLLKHGFSASCHEKIANSEARTTGCETKSQESERTCTQENLACVSEFQVDAGPACSQHGKDFGSSFACLDLYLT